MFLKYKIKALGEYYVCAQMDILQIIYGASLRHVTFPSAVRFNLRLTTKSYTIQIKSQSESYDTIISMIIYH